MSTFSSLKTRANSICSITDNEAVAALSDIVRDLCKKCGELEDELKKVKRTADRAESEAKKK